MKRQNLAQKIKRSTLWLLLGCPSLFLFSCVVPGFGSLPPSVIMVFLIAIVLGFTLGIALIVRSFWRLGYRDMAVWVALAYIICWLKLLGWA